MPKDTETQIVELLKGLMEPTGLINVPLAAMAQETGLSVSTVWRALQSLEDKGVISIYKSKKSTEPNTILYKDAEIMTLIEQAEAALEACHKLLQGIRQKLKE
ncbi:MAG TPA: winged helix-turn-helix transcriptional regulator [Pseudoneobacillus sp.]|nr:winged helix-turn-helix transcriptional regulator [Pseudoneobacillus sp.]